MYTVDSGSATSGSCTCSLFLKPGADELVCALQAVYAFGRLAIFYKSSGTRHYVLLTLASLIHFACYSFIKLQAGKGLQPCQLAQRDQHLLLQHQL